MDDLGDWSDKLTSFRCTTSTGDYGYGYDYKRSMKNGVRRTVE